MAEKIVKRKDMVTVYGTGVSKYLPQGKKYSVHSVAGENLIAKGFAQTTPIAAEGKGKKEKV